MNRTFRKIVPILVAVGCAPQHPLEPPRRGREEAWKIAERLIQETPTLSVRRERDAADGTFGYLELINREPGRLITRLAVAPSGRVDSLEEVRSRFDAHHVEVWGNIDHEGARLLHLAADDQLFDVYGVPRRLGETGEALEFFRTIDPSAAMQLSESFFSLRATKRQIVDTLSRSIYVQRAEVRSSTGLSKTAVTWPSGGIPMSEWVPSTSLTTGTHVEANAQGFYGRTVKVGILETYKSRSLTAAGCRIWTGHEAFSALTGVHYQQPNPIPCATGIDADCTVSGTDLRCDVGKCINGECVDIHATEVASRIAAAQGASGMIPGGEFHAAQVSLYFEQNRSNTAIGGGGPAGFTGPELDAALDYFAGEEVKLINLSVGGSPGHDAIAVQLDFRARHGGLVAVMGAGNNPSPSEQVGINSVVTCQGFNTICVGGSNINRLAPEDRSDYFNSAPGRWRNLNQNGWEFEKPDVSAEGDSAHVLAFTGTKDWTTNSGTSFAAPTVTGLIALHQDYCEGVTANRGSAFYRAFLRSVGTADLTPVELFSGPTMWSGSHQPSCPGLSTTPAYPNVAIGCDHHNGAGPVMAKYMFLSRSLCHEDPNPTCFQVDGEEICIHSGTGTLTPDSSWQPVPEWAQSGSPPVDNYTSALRQPSAYRSVLYAGGGYWKDLRVRTTFAYFSCPDKEDSPASGSGPAVNFDLALVGRDRATGQWEVIGASEGLTDATEGYDVTMRKDYDQHEVWVVGPDPTSAGWGPCNGAKSEPYWWWNFYK